MSTIIEVQPVATEIILQERIVSNEFRIVEIVESIRDRHVRVEVELGPFITHSFPNGQTIYRGSSQRGINVWNNEEYDAIRDTWTNADLMAAVKLKLESQ